VVALTGFTGSAVPDGDRLPPGDHAEMVLETRSARYHTLRNRLRAAGVESEDWIHYRHAEPHTGERGGGANRGYVHDHDVIVVDAAALECGDRPATEAVEEAVAPALEKHVEECPVAGAEAHRPAEALEVRRPEDLEDPAAYVAGYVSVEPEDLLERSPEYLLFAATMNATNKKVRSKSNRAKDAVRADRCKQRYESPESEQDLRHGEHVRQERDRQTGERYLVCAECGSGHGIEDELDDGGTLVNERLGIEDGAEPAVATDGGEPAEPSGGGEGDVAPERSGVCATARDAAAAVSVGVPTRIRRAEDALSEALRGAREDASDPEVFGRVPSRVQRECSLADLRRALVRLRGEVETEAESVERPVGWQLVAVEVGDDRLPASPGSGVKMVETDPDPKRELATAEWFEDRERYVCNCGVCAYGKTYLAHLHGRHGIESGEVAAAVTRREDAPGEEDPEPVAPEVYDPAA
jgi:hypothetical protein